MEGGKGDYKWAAQESSFVVIDQFCLLIVVMVFDSTYVNKMSWRYTQRQTKKEYVQKLVKFKQSI